MVLWNGGAVGNAVRCAARGKDNVLHAGVQHGIEESQRVGHIVAEVLARTFHGFADISARGEVDYGAHAVVFERIANQHGVPEVPLDQRSPFHVRAVACYEIVQDDGLEPRARQCFRSVRSNVARAPCDEHSHGLQLRRVKKPASTSRLGRIKSPVYSAASLSRANVAVG